jgi:hypothetical protein
MGPAALASNGITGDHYSIGRMNPPADKDRVATVVKDVRMQLGQGGTKEES